jgi:hypothetical protein
LLLTASCLTVIEVPPARGRPAHYSGAIGERFVVVSFASRSRVQAEDPIFFRLLVRCEGRCWVAPEKPNLAELRGFKGVFQVKDQSEFDLASVRPEGREWEFCYLLRPLSASAERIPRVRFDYYRPGNVPPEKGYRTTFTEPIPLEVAPRGKAVVASVDAPEATYRIVAGTRVLRRDAPWDWPGPLGLTVFLAGPPLACMAWFWVWSRLFPDAARLARIHRSLAAKLALADLARALAGDAETQARHIASTLVTYLQRRMDWSRCPPTARLAEIWLRDAGVEPALASKFGRFLRDCEAARYGPDHHLAIRPADAERLVLDLEAERSNLQ